MHGPLCSPQWYGHGTGRLGSGEGIIRKTLQELYDEVRGDDALKKSFVEAMRKGVVEDFLREHGCEATPEELREFLECKAKESDPLELSADENPIAASFPDLITKEERERAMDGIRRRLDEGTLSLPETLVERLAEQLRFAAICS